jgi:hypothetical protein
MNASNDTARVCGTITQRGYGLSSYISRTALETSSWIGDSTSIARASRRSSATSLSCVSISGRYDIVPVVRRHLAQPLGLRDRMQRRKECGDQHEWPEQFGGARVSSSIARASLARTSSSSIPSRSSTIHAYSVLKHCAARAPANTHIASVPVPVCQACSM